MITLSHVQKQFGSKTLFENCSMQIGVRDRIGLIGPNGSGKTTLFRMVLGEEPIDEGEILIAKGVKMGYLPQEVISLRGNRVLEETLKGAPGITSLQDKMKILEEELSTIEDPNALTQRMIDRAMKKLPPESSLTVAAATLRRPTCSMAPTIINSPAKKVMVE